MAERDLHRVLGGERRDHILRELRSHGAVTVNGIAAELGVSAMTVRRDINVLAERGLLTRVHGGATLPDPWQNASSPSDGTRSVVQRSRFTVGMVVPQLDYYFPPVVAGARAAALDARARLVVRTTAYDPDEERHQIARLVATPGIDGVIVAPDLAGEHGAQLLRWLDRLTTPVVLVERRPPSVSPFRSLEWVASDHASGAAAAVWHLHGQGHQQIGILTMARKATTPHLLRGWHDALRALGLAPEVQLQGHTDGFGEPGRAELMAATLAEVARTGTTALLVHSDPYALNFVQFCAEKGVSVPGDLAVVAYDDEVAEFGDPPLTAVRPPKTEVGRQAVEVLVARLVEGARRPAHRVMVEPTLVVRESSVRRA